MFTFLRGFRPWASIPNDVGSRIIFVEDGVRRDRTGFLDSNGQASWTLTRNQRGQASVPFQVSEGTAWAPQRGWPIYLYEVYRSLNTSKCVWLGTVSKVDMGWLCGNLGQLAVQVSAIGPERMFDGIQTPVVEYNDTTTGVIFADLLSYALGFTLPIPITAGTIGSGALVKNRKYDGKSSISSAFQQLATDTPDYIQYIDPATQEYNFHAYNAKSSPITITNGMMLMGTIKWSGTDVDFRDTQVIQVSPDISPSDVAVFTGDGSTTSFTLPKLGYQVVGAAVVNGTNNVHASAVGTFSGNPSDGDTITIGDSTYTFRNTLDHTVFGEVKIGADAEESAANAYAAITAAAGAGTKYSYPTWTNPTATAAAPSGSPALQIVVAAKVLGTAGNVIALGATGTAFSWSDSTLGGGQDISGVALRVGPAGSGSYDLEYNLGSDTVTLRQAPLAGKAIVVTYKAVGSDLLTVSNGASADLGVGADYRIMTARNAKTLEAALQQAKAVLARYSQLPAEVQWSMDVPGISVGQFVPVSISTPNEADAVLNGNWIVQQVQGSLPAPKWEKQEEPYGHFRYQIDLINSLDIGTPEDVADRLADTGPNDSPATSNPSQPPDQGPSSSTLPTVAAFGLADLTVRNNVTYMPPVLTPVTDLTSPPSHEVKQGYRIVTTLTEALTADCTYRVNKTTWTSPPTVVSWTVDVPSTWPIGFPKVDEISGDFNDLDTLSLDVVSSDGQQAVNGIIHGAVEWR